MVNKATKELTEKIITWMKDDIRLALQYKRQTSEGFKKRSEQNRRNKIEGIKDKIGHNQGSISATMWDIKLVREAKYINYSDCY